VKVALIVAAASALLIVVGAAGYVVGKSSAPSASEARDAQQAAFAETYRATAAQAASQAKKVAFTASQGDGREAGTDDGSKKAAAQVAASQSPASTGGCPPGSDAFGNPPACIARPAPGVSPEYDSCVADGGFPTPDGCVKQ
jgi:hypothetical protein